MIQLTQAEYDALAKDAARYRAFRAMHVDPHRPFRWDRFLDDRIARDGARKAADDRSAPCS